MKPVRITTLAIIASFFLLSCDQTFNCRCVVTDPDTNKQTESISVGTYSSFFGMKKQAKENCEVKKDGKTDEYVTCTLE